MLPLPPPPPILIGPDAAAQLDDGGYREGDLLDIVLAYYHEDLQEVANLTAQIMALPVVRRRRPRVFLYSKNKDMSPSGIKRWLPYAKISSLPNLGRESHVSNHQVPACVAAGMQQSCGWSSI
jgi:hypothetical protein